MTSIVASSITWSTPAGSVNGDRRSSKSSVTKAYSPDWKLYAGFAGLCVLSLASALDATVLVAGLPIIISKLKGTTIQAIWISASYHLASSIFQPFFVSISFICGRKPLLAASAFLGVVGCVICGVAPSTILLIIGRVLQGAGGGASTALAEVIISDIIPAEFRPRWLMVMNVVWAVGTAGGPVLGAVLVDTNLWKLIFYLNIGLHLVGGILPMILTVDIKKPRSMGKALLKFDWAGFGLLIVSFTTLLMAITLGGSIYPWSSWQLIVLLLVTAITSVLYIVLECFYIRNPFIDLWRLKDLTGLTTFLCTFLHGFIFWSLLSYLPIYYESVKDLTPIQSAMALLPETASIIPAFVIFGLIISRTTRYKWILFTSWALTCIGTGLLALLDTGTATPVWIIVNILAGIGIGMIFSGLVFASQATATALKQDFAFGASMLHFFRSCGAAAGITASGTIFQHEFSKRLSSITSLLPKAAEYTTQAFQLALKTNDLPFTVTPDENYKFMEAYAYGLKKIWLTIGILAITGTVTCVFAKEYGNHVYSRVRDEKELAMEAKRNGSVTSQQEVV